MPPSLLMPHPGFQCVYMPSILNWSFLRCRTPEELTLCPNIILLRLCFRPLLTLMNQHFSLAPHWTSLAGCRQYHQVPPCSPLNQNHYGQPSPVIFLSSVILFVGSTLSHTAIDFVSTAFYFHLLGHWNRLTILNVVSGKLLRRLKILFFSSGQRGNVSMTDQGQITEHQRSLKELENDITRIDEALCMVYWSRLHPRHTKSPSSTDPFSKVSELRTALRGFRQVIQDEKNNAQYVQTFNDQLNAVKRGLQRLATESDGLKGE